MTEWISKKNTKKKEHERQNRHVGVYLDDRVLEKEHTEWEINNN